MAQIATELPRRRRLTVVDYFRMAQAGILGRDERVELIEGEIIDMTPPGSLHAGTVTQLADLLRRAVGDAALLQVQNPLSLDEYSEPEPDLALLRPRADFYKSRHPLPTDTLLVVEVADTPIGFDRDVKIALYARHRLAEAWLVDVRGQALTRYREPDQGTYTRVDSPDLTQPIELSSLPGLVVDLRSLFGT